LESLAFSGRVGMNMEKDVMHTPTRVVIDFFLVDPGYPLNGIKFVMVGGDIGTLEV
jgi:hypothetical protein